MANPVTDFWFWATTGKTASQIEAETARNDAILAARDADLIARGLWSDKDIRDSANQRAAEDYAANIGGQVAQAAGEGAAEGLDAMQSAVKETVTGAATFSLKATLGWIPWWLWLVGAAYLALRLGLLAPALSALKIKVQ